MRQRSPHLRQQETHWGTGHIMRKSRGKTATPGKQCTCNVLVRCIAASRPARKEDPGPVQLDSTCTIQVTGEVRAAQRAEVMSLQKTLSAPRQSQEPPAVAAGVPTNRGAST